MAIKYKFVRVPLDVFGNMKIVKGKMETDVKCFTGKPMRIPFTQVLRAVFSPEYNENFIQVDLSKLSKLGVRRR